MKDLLLEALKVLFQIAVLFLTPYVIKALGSIEQKAVATMGATNFELAKSFAGTIVKAVEQMNPSLKGNDKFVMAFNAIDDKFGDHLSKDEITALVEAAVKEYNVAIGKPITTE